MGFDLKAEEVKSFEGQFYRFTQINGPITLVRFSHSGSGERGRLGRFWLYGDEVKEILVAGLGGLRTIKEISQRWAICDDWGDKMLMSLMDIPPGEEIPAAWGRTAFQPKVKQASVRPTGRSYAGGSLQLIIPIIDTNMPPVVDRRISGLITRRLQTATVVSNPPKYLENPWVTAQRKRGRNI